MVKLLRRAAQHLLESSLHCCRSVVSCCTQPSLVISISCREAMKLYMTHAPAAVNFALVQLSSELIHEANLDYEQCSNSNCWHHGYLKPMISKTHTCCCHLCTPAGQSPAKTAKQMLPYQSYQSIARHTPAAVVFALLQVSHELLHLAILGCQGLCLLQCRLLAVLDSVLAQLHQLALNIVKEQGECLCKVTALIYVGSRLARTGLYTSWHADHW